MQVLDLFRLSSIHPIHLTYRAVGSEQGQAEFIGDASSAHSSYTNFSLAGLPFSSSEHAAMQSVYQRTFLQIPVALSAVSVFHSVPPQNLPSVSARIKDHDDDERQWSRDSVDSAAQQPSPGPLRTHVAAGGDD